MGRHRSPSGIRCTQEELIALMKAFQAAIQTGKPGCECLGRTTCPNTQWIVLYVDKKRIYVYMVRIFTYIYHQNEPHVGKYPIHWVSGMFLCKVNPKKCSRIGKENHDSHIWNPHNTYPCSTGGFHSCRSWHLSCHSYRGSKLQRFKVRRHESCSGWVDNMVYCNIQFSHIFSMCQTFL